MGRAAKPLNDAGNNRPVERGSHRRAACRDRLTSPALAGDRDDRAQLHHVMGHDLQSSEPVARGRGQQFISNFLLRIPKLTRDYRAIGRFSAIPVGRRKLFCHETVIF